MNNYIQFHSQTDSELVVRAREAYSTVSLRIDEQKGCYIFSVLGKNNERIELSRVPFSHKETL